MPHSIHKAENYILRRVGQTKIPHPHNVLYWNVTNYVRISDTYIAVDLIYNVFLGHHHTTRQLFCASITQKL